MSDQTLGVHSETGKLRQVIVCRPGLAHRRLTPDNCQELLFDDVFWVKQAQKDHDVFASVMRDEGVEVLDVNDLLAETLDLAEGRKYVLDHRINRDQVGVGMLAELRAWMEELPGAKLAEYLLGGLATGDLPFKPSGLFGAYLGHQGLILPPLPNALFTRDNSAWIYGGVSVNPMHWPARRPETLLNTAIYKFHPKFAGKAEIYFGDPGVDHGLATVEGGDIMPVGTGTVLVGMGERSSPQGIGHLAVALFEKGAAQRVLDFAIPKSRAAMHLDTIFTLCGGNVVTTFREVAEDLVAPRGVRDGHGVGAGLLPLPVDVVAVAAADVLAEPGLHVHGSVSLGGVVFTAWRAAAPSCLRASACADSPRRCRTAWLRRPRRAGRPPSCGSHPASR